MFCLHRDHPAVYQHCVEGMHEARRSERAWAALSTDLMIEQVIMRTLKTRVGLTRGKCMTEQHRLTWVVAMPACAEVNRAMQEFSGVKYTTSEQNKEMDKAIQHRDMKDTHTLLLTLSDRNPFTGVPYPRNIMTAPERR